MIVRKRNLLKHQRRTDTYQCETCVHLTHCTEVEPSGVRLPCMVDVPDHARLGERPVAHSMIRPTRCLPARGKATAAAIAIQPTTWNASG